MSKNIREMLRDYPEQKVERFIAYVNELKTDKKSGGALRNPWATKKNDDWYISRYRDVADNVGLYIDGRIVSLTSIGVTYDYNAYKNIVLQKYPESTFDFELVYEGDDYVFFKKNGEITYNHTIKNPFSTKKNIIGAYGIIKNRLGEFLEVITLQDIEKFKNSSKMKHLWENWFDRMVLKSVIKRICKAAFYDIVSEMDVQDNENSNPDNASIPAKLQEKVAACNTREELGQIFKPSYKKDRAISALFKQRMDEIKNNPDTKVKVDQKTLNIAIGNIITGVLLEEDFLAKHFLTKEQTEYFQKSIKGE